MHIKRKNNCKSFALLFSIQAYEIGLGVSFLSFFLSEFQTSFAPQKPYFTQIEEELREKFSRH